MDNLDILETDKKDDYSLGKTLKIDSITYSDLDELLVSHIESIIAKMETLMTSPKYKENAADLSKSCFVIFVGSQDCVEHIKYDTNYFCFLVTSTLEQSLDTATKAKPGAAVYGFTLDRKHAGYFLLIYKLGGNRPIHEMGIKVLPETYILKGQSSKECKDLNSLTNSFKEMMMQMSRPKPAPAPMPSTRSTVHMGGPHSHSGMHPSAMGSHHYVPHQAQPHMAHQPIPMQGAPWGTPWGGAPWTGAPGGHMGQGGHMTGPPGHGGPGTHDGYGSRSSRAPPTPRRFMPPPGQQPYY